MKLTCLIDSTRRVIGAVVGIAFDTLDGARVLTLDSDNSGAELTLDPGLNEITMTLPRNPLTPGMYSCAASIFSGKTIIDSVSSFATWEVHPGETDRGFAGCRPELVLEKIVAHETVPV
jgi:lipopolysaccharide transport system ATP-binding protein